MLCTENEYLKKTVEKRSKDTVSYDVLCIGYDKEAFVQDVRQDVLWKGKV